LWWQGNVQRGRHVLTQKDVELTLSPSLRNERINCGSLRRPLKVDCETRRKGGGPKTDSARA
jgi:hypothetical protein